MPLVLIAIGGAAGAVARYLVDTSIAQRAAGAFPWGTIVVNVSGSVNSLTGGPADADESPGHAAEATPAR